MASRDMGKLTRQCCSPLQGLGRCRATTGPGSFPDVLWDLGRVALEGSDTPLRSFLSEALVRVGAHVLLGLAKRRLGPPLRRAVTPSFTPK